MNTGGSCGECLCLSFFSFLRSDLSLLGYRNRYFLVALCRLIIRKPNLEVATKRLLHQQAKILGSFSVMFAHGSASPAISGDVNISEVPGCQLLRQMSSQ